jgi:hypothetical protein
MRRFLLPEVFVEPIWYISPEADRGKTVTITNVVSDLTGHPPRTFSEFARDHAALFRG